MQIRNLTQLKLLAKCVAHSRCPITSGSILHLFFHFSWYQLGRVFFLEILPFLFFLKGRKPFQPLGMWCLISFWLSTGGQCSRQVPPESFLVLCKTQAVSAMGPPCGSLSQVPRSCSGHLSAVAGLQLLPPPWQPALGHWGEWLGQQLLVPQVSSLSVSLPVLYPLPVSCPPPQPQLHIAASIILNQKTHLPTG